MVTTGTSTTYLRRSVTPLNLGAEEFNSRRVACLFVGAR